MRRPMVGKATCNRCRHYRLPGQARGELDGDAESTGKWPRLSRGLFLLGAAIGCWLIVIMAILMLW